MASNIEFVEYLCEQMKDAGYITYRKMFGEFGVYCDGKIIGLVTDNEFYLKPTEVARTLLGECVIERPPYKGAKDYFLITDLDNSDFLSKIVQASYRELPEAKPKKRKKE